MTFRAREAKGGSSPVAGEWVVRELPPAVAGWSDRRLLTLAAVVDTIVPGQDAPRRAGAIAASISATAAAADVEAVGTLLDRLDGTGRGPLRGHAFVGQEAGHRWRALASIEERGVPDLRGALERVRRAVLMGAWGGGASASASRLAGIGYHPDRAGTATTPEPVRALPVEPGSAPLLLDADVVIVGSGAAGGVVAQRLSEAGMAVLVVEAGRSIAEGDLPRREAVALESLYLDRATTLTTDGSMAILAGATVGGGTSIGWTSCSIPAPAILADWALHHGLDGIDGRDAASDVARLRGELGFLQPVATPARDRIVFAGAAALGWEAAPGARNADACRACGSCSFGCPAGTKRAGVRLHLSDAAAHGARLLAGATADRVLLDAGAVTGVSGSVVAADGSTRPFRVAAPRVVVAAGALRTPSLLVRSGLRHPGLGAHLLLGPSTLMIAGIDGAAVAWSGPLAGVRGMRFAAPGGASAMGPGPAHRGFVMGTAPLHPGLLAASLPWEGSDANERLMANAGSLVPLTATIRDEEPGRLVIDRDGPPRIELTVGRRDAMTIARARIELARLGRAGGARLMLVPGLPGLRWTADDGDAGFGAFLDALSAAPPRGLLSTSQAGSAHAGSDPRMAPCDPWGQVRRGPDGTIVRGLRVADASLAPGSPGPDPMVTVMLLGARVARAILAER